MSTNTYIAIGVVILIVVGGFFLLQGNQAGLPEQQEDQQQGEAADHGTPATHTVTYTDEGYSPREVTVNHGDTVVFKNQSSTEMWPATAIHPTHTIYPGSDITKCGTPEASKIFDACEPIGQGGSWSFVFEEHDSWGYHDHLDVSNTARIIVE